MVSYITAFTDAKFHTSKINLRGFSGKCLLTLFEQISQCDIFPGLDFVSTHITMIFFRFCGWMGSENETYFPF